MSLWSPVDLVTGGSGTRNINANGAGVSSTAANNSNAEQSSTQYGNCEQDVKKKSKKQAEKKRQSNDVKDFTENIKMSVKSDGLNRLSAHHENHTTSHLEHQQTKRSFEGSDGHIHGNGISSSKKLCVNEPPVENNLAQLTSVVKSSEDEDDDAPLNLCVKKKKPENDSQTTVSSNIRTKSTCPPIANSVHYHHRHHQSHRPPPSFPPPSLSAATAVSISALNTSKRRGRKPKSFQQQAGQSIVVHASDAPTPRSRKRGRPPLLSPPASVAVTDNDHIPAAHQVASHAESVSRGFVNSALYHQRSSSSSGSSKQHAHIPLDASVISSLLQAGGWPTFGDVSGRGAIKERRTLSSDDDSPNENHRAEDVDLIRIPLGLSWRRQTFVCGYSRGGVRGDVLYAAPCGRKLKNIQEVSKYLLKYNVSNVTAANFSFNPKLLVGDFFEVNTRDGDMKALTEEELTAKVNELKGYNSKQPQRRSRKAPTSEDGGNFVKPNLADFFDAKTLQSVELSKSTELIRKAQERELKRYHAELQKEKELQKKKEIQMLAEIERERRKQHMLLVRSMDALRRHEERERKREEMLVEKRLVQERKIQKRKMEMELLKELKKPVDDMLLKHDSVFPALNRIPGLKLPGKTFSNLLMVYEFLHNFGETLGFDMESLPSLNTLQEAVLNSDEMAEEELLSIIHHLLVCVIDDPGSASHVTTIMGQKLKDAPITNFNISEILRLYFQSFLSPSHKSHHLVLDRVEVRLSHHLEGGIPFLALSASIKTQIMAALCNELLCNQAIVKQIEDNIENVATLRRDKWVVETELRKFKAIKQRRERRTELEEGCAEDRKSEKTMDESQGGTTAEGAVDSGAESDGETGHNGSSVTTPHDQPDDDFELPNDELDRKVDSLSRKCTMVTNRLNRAIHSLRITSLGQDRYRRRYWVLPSSGALFVEGIESGEPEELECNLPDGKHDEEMKESEDEKIESQKSDEGKTHEECKADQDKVQDPKALLEEAEEKQEVKSNSTASEDEQGTKDVPKPTEVVGMKTDLTVDTKTEVKEGIKTEVEEKLVSPRSEEAMDEKPESKRSKEQIEESNLANSLKKELQAKGIESQWLSPIVASVLAGSMIFGNPTGMNNNSMSNGFNSSFPFPFPGFDLNARKAASAQRPWFSLMPRIACSDLNSSSTVFNESSSMVNGLPLNHNTMYPNLLGSLMNPQSKATSSESTPSTSRPSSVSNLKDDHHPLHTLSTNSLLTNSALLNEMDVCPALQRKLAQQREEQHVTLQTIPMEVRYGWWRITDVGQLKQILESLNERGARERQLHRYLTKYFNYVSSKCKSAAAELEITNMDREISANPFGAPIDVDIDGRHWNESVALRQDIGVLEQIEALEEKVATSSMQVRGWRPQNKISSDSEIRFSIANMYRAWDETRGELDDDEYVADEGKDKVNPVTAGRERLLAAEAVIERRYLKPPLGFKSNSLIMPVTCSTSSNLLAEDELADNASDENAPNGLLRWREAVRECRNGSQLALLLHFLEACIAWDKSIMRASCQFCESGENEAQLLLCDGCDKGYHMYCFKPKMDTIPEGDWYCFECQNKNTIDKVCIVCGKKGKLLNCDTCPKVFHPNCIDPPVTKPPKGRWSCSMCFRKPRKPKHCKKTPVTEDKSTTHNTPSTSSGVSSTEKPARKSSAKANKAVTNRASSESPSSLSEPAKRTERRSSSNSNAAPKEQDKDMLCCEQLIDELQQREESWPFMKPVNTKQFPTYKKIIKKPMDLATIRSKLDAGGYKTRSDFLADIRLIFDNCETFNEDESPVGIAGHTMRLFFDKQCKELQIEDKL